MDAICRDRKPAISDANNGNWQTAQRWQQFFAGHANARIARSWPDKQSAGDKVMLALHARRSADAVEAWAHARNGAGLAVVLTGTDLYQDIAVDARAQRSLQFATRLVVLQQLGPAALPPELREKTRVIYQSAPSLPPLPKEAGVLRALMVGHLR